MPRFDRYMLSQLMMLFGFFALILVSVYWVNRAVSLLDQLISDGQSAWVFLEFTALTLPNVIRLVLPIAAFVATVYVTNRLSSESELVVMQATGFSPFRLARPVLYFGVIVGVMMAILVHILVPASRARLEERHSEIAQNVAARFLTEGSFLHPAQGVTLYIRQITLLGELNDIFLADARDEGVRVTHTADRALLVKSETGPKLVMFDGLSQRLDQQTGRLAVTRFANFSYDIGALIADVGPRRIDPDELPTARLLWPDAAAVELTNTSADRLRFAGHERITRPFLPLIASLFGFATLLIGGFSRHGLAKQITGSVLLLIFLQMLVNATDRMVATTPSAWPMVYVPILVGLLIAAGLLRLAGRTRRTRHSFVEAVAS